MDSIQQDFRNAMAACAAGVYLITTDGEHGRYGITMTSVAPVTDTPPTVVLCVNLNTRICPILTGNGELCINVLSATSKTPPSILPASPNSPTKSVSSSTSGTAAAAASCRSTTPSPTCTAASSSITTWAPTAFSTSASKKSA